MGTVNKIVVVSMAKNEADIIESFVRHSLTFADELIIADHQSSDKTYDILVALANEGLPITIHRLYRVELAHREVMNALTHEAFLGHGADLVLPMDADEFLVNTENSLSCRAILESLDTRRVHQLNWIMYEPADPDNDLDRFLLARRAKRGLDYAPAQKCLVGVDFYERGARPVELVQGCHYVEFLDDSSMVGMEPVPYVHVAHYHWRSNAQYASKVATSWINNVTKYTVQTLTASYLKGCYDALKRHETVYPDNLLDQSEEIVLAGYVPEQTLRYTPATLPDMTINLLSAAENIAQQLAQEKLISQEKVLTSIVPFWGDNAELQQRLENIAEDLYPYKEIIVLVMAGALDSQRENYIDSLRRKYSAQVLVTDGNYAAELESAVHGDYVELRLPGKYFYPNKNIEQAVALASDPVNLGLVFASGTPSTSPSAREITLGLIEQSMGFFSGDEFYKTLISSGCHPVAGISGALFHRAVIERIGYFAGYYIDAMPLELTMYVELLKKVIIPARLFLGIMDTSYAPADNDISAADVRFSKLEWQSLKELAEVN